MSYDDYKYEVIVYWSEEDNSFLVEVPELLGCMADGKSYEEALKNVQAIIREWIEIAIEEARPIPKPKGRMIYA